MKFHLTSSNLAPQTFLNTMMHILIAPNAFKNSIDAEAVAMAIREGLDQSKLECTSELFPIGDGGDGTGNLIIRKCGGTLVHSSVNDPLGRSINASFGLIEEGNTAIIEMANASGLRLLKLDELNPLRTTSFGTGEQMNLALDKGVKKIVIAMGGSATVDGAAGILQALGIRFLNSTGESLQNLPEDLHHLASIDTSLLDQRILKCEVVVLCDVDNFLLGENGSAAIFGPQKGASLSDVAKLDAALQKLSEISLLQTGKDMSTIPSGGTAGGAAAGLWAFLNARLVNGIEYFKQLTGFEAALEKSNLVITGEGSIDDQTLQGKGPYGVASSAKLKNIPVIGLAGKVPLNKSNDLAKYFDVLLTIGNQPSDLETAMHCSKENLIRVSREIGNLLSFAKLF